MPNSYAERLLDMIQKDFSGHLPATILKAPVGTYLTEQLYQNLDQTTLSVVLLTASITDSDGKRYSRPNIYHELGYLMRQLGKRRVFIVRDKSVEVPSNIQDAIRTDIPNGNIEISYIDLLEWLARVSWLPQSTVSGALKKHRKRLARMVLTGHFTADEAKVPVARAEELIDNLRQ